MEAGSINTNTFALTGPGGAVVPGVVTSSGPTAYFNPDNNLAPNTVYTARITTGAADATDNPIAANVVWTFTTGP